MTSTSHPTSPPDPFAYDVFISYSHKNEAWVHSELLARLTAHGLSVCIDTECFELGASSVLEMERAVRTSRKTVLVLTPEYVESDWSQFERLMLQTLDPINRQRRLIPLLLAGCNLPISISFLTHVSFTDPNTQASAWNRLLRALTPR
jgi:hypothetical protein